MSIYSVIITFLNSLSCYMEKLTQFMSLDTMIKRKMFVKFLQNLEKVMKGFSKVIN